MGHLSWKEWWEDYHYACGYDRVKAYRLVAFIRWLRYLINCAICTRIGHNIECEDWGNEESGGVAGHCKRCGWSYHHVLY